jgi:hypothetical protein
MALPSSGAIAFSDINTEIGVSATTLRSLNDAAVRTIFGQASGAVDMNTGHGKSYRVSSTFTFAANATNQTVALASLSGYIAGKSCITITINSGVYVYSTSTATPAITFTGGTTGDALTIVNNGYIMGMGGAGGGHSNSAGSGGNAISLSYPATINNTNTSAYIGGGGGGGRGGFCPDGQGGGGAGGGAGGSSAEGYGGAPVVSGGLGGAIGQKGGNGSQVYQIAPYCNAGRGGGAGGGAGSSGSPACANGAWGGGGGGGRIFPGTGGLGICGGSSGGSANNPGGVAGNTTTTDGVSIPTGGGGWGASGGGAYVWSYVCQGSNGCVHSGTTLVAGAAGGKAVALNGKTVTWVSGCTARVYGSIS